MAENSQDPRPSTQSLTAAAKAAGGKGPAPVHLWNPPFCGDLDIRIHRDGTWSYLGSPIGRESLVRLFSSILKMEEGKYYLVTPVEKVGIQVEDAPFVAVDVTAEGGDLRFTTQVGDEVTASPDHPIRMSADQTPYVMVRAGLEARVDRKTFYRLVDMGEYADIAGVSWFGLRSAGAFFPLLPASDLGIEG